MKLLLAVLMMVFSSVVVAEPQYLRTESWNSLYLLCELSGESEAVNFTLQHNQKETLKGKATVVIENRRQVYDDPEENFDFRYVQIGDRGDPFFSILNTLETVDKSNEKEFKFTSETDTGTNDFKYLSINRMTGSLSFSERNWMDLSSIGKVRTTKELFGSCEKQTKQKF